MITLIDLNGLANLVGVVNKKITPEVIYAFVKDYQDLSDQPLRIDPVSEKFLFLPVLDSIIQNPDTPHTIQCAASDMWYFVWVWYNPTSWFFDH